MSFSILFPTNEFTASSKTPEEIQRLTLPCNLPLSDSLLHIASKGLPQQYPYLFRHLPEAHSPVLPFVCSRASVEEPQNQQLILTSLKKLFQEKAGLLTQAEKDLILEASLQCLNSQSPHNQDLISLIELILNDSNDRPKLLRRLENHALELGKSNQSSISKVTAGRLITILGSYSGRSIKNEFVDILKKIFNDIEVEARKIGISDIFPRLLQVFDLEFVELHFQERIFEAVWGEDEEIGVLALEVILKNASRFGQIEQSSRIVKLFVDSLTSKSERMALVAIQLVGETYQKLQHVILRNEIYCLRFWRSLIELSQSKNERVLNLMVFNLPGVLTLAAPYHRVDPLCDIYIDLFYNSKSNKVLLASYFHEMVQLFPSKGRDLKELFYWMLQELLEENVLCDQAIRITGKIITWLPQIQHIFKGQGLLDGRSQPRQERSFEAVFCSYVLRLLDLLVRQKVSAAIVSLLASLRSICQCFSSEFVEFSLLPKIYSCLRAKVAGDSLLVKILVTLLAREGNPVLTNTYISKASSQLMRSSRSFEREAAMHFFLECTFQFSLEMVQEYRLGQKFLSFNSDKNFKIRCLFISQLPRLLYFLTREERIEYSIIVNRLRKDPSHQIQQVFSRTDFSEEEATRQKILAQSRALRQFEKEKLALNNGRKELESISRKPLAFKDIRKEDVLRKRIESSNKNKAGTKVVLKEVPRRRMAPLMLKTNSNINVLKNS